MATVSGIIGQNAAGMRGAYTPEVIKKYMQDNNLVNAQGVDINPEETYKRAQQFGVSGSQIDQAMGWAPNTSNGWVQQNHLSPLSQDAQRLDIDRSNIAADPVSSPIGLNGSGQSVANATPNSYYDPNATNTMGANGMIDMSMPNPNGLGANAVGGVATGQQGVNPWAGYDGQPQVAVDGWGTSGLPGMPGMNSVGGIMGRAQTQPLNWFGNGFRRNFQY